VGTGCCGVDPCAFAGVPSSNYWSSTTLAGPAINAWDVALVNGTVVNNAKALNFLVWPVRAGP
jgi:hypothetical protein